MFAEARVSGEVARREGVSRARLTQVLARLRVSLLPCPVGTDREPNENGAMPGVRSRSTTTERTPFPIALSAIVDVAPIHGAHGSVWLGQPSYPRRGARDFAF